MAFTAAFSVNVGDPTKASDVSTLAANDDFLKAAADSILVNSAATDGAISTTGSAVFNEGGADKDFRVESSGNANMLMVDGGTNKVGIGIAASDGTLHVHTASSGSATPSTSADDLVVENSTHCGVTILAPASNTSNLYLGKPADVDRGAIWHDHDNDYMRFKAGGSTSMTLNSSGRLGIGTDTPDSTLHVHTASAGSVAATSMGNAFVIENSTASGMSILTPDSNTSNIVFGCPSNPDYAYFDAFWNSGNVRLRLLGVDGGSVLMQWEGDGGIKAPNLLAASASTDVNINGSDELHSVTSSAFYKEAVRDLEIDSSLIYQITPRSYRFGAEKTRPDGWPDPDEASDDFGLIAEEVHEIIPELVQMREDVVVSTDDDGREVRTPQGTSRPYSVRYSILPVLLLAELQKLRAEIDAIKNN